MGSCSSTSNSSSSTKRRPRRRRRQASDGFDTLDNISNPDAGKEEKPMNLRRAGENMTGNIGRSPSRSNSEQNGSTFQNGSHNSPGKLSSIWGNSFDKNADTSSKNCAHSRTRQTGLTSSNEQRPVDASAIAAVFPDSKKKLSAKLSGILANTNLSRGGVGSHIPPDAEESASHSGGSKDSGGSKSASHSGGGEPRRGYSSWKEREELDQRREANSSVWTGGGNNNHSGHHHRSDSPDDSDQCPGDARMDLFDTRNPFDTERKVSQSVSTESTGTGSSNGTSSGSFQLPLKAPNEMYSPREAQEGSPTPGLGGSGGDGTHGGSLALSAPNVRRQHRRGRTNDAVLGKRANNQLVSASLNDRALEAALGASNEDGNFDGSSNSYTSSGDGSGSILSPEVQSCQGQIFSSEGSNSSLVGFVKSDDNIMSESESGTSEPLPEQMAKALISNPLLAEYGEWTSAEEDQALY